MNRLLFFFTNILFLIASLSGFGQTPKSRIYGKTLDDSGQPVPFANISIDSLHLGTVSDAEGNFILKNVPPGSHKISVSSIGYTRNVTNHNVKLNARNEMLVKLVESQSQLDDVVVTSKSEAQQVRETPFTVSSVELKEMKSLNVDLNSVLNRVPGLRIRESGGLGSDMNITLNGMSSLRIFIDGLPADGFGSSFSFNNFPINIIDRIDVYRGVTPVFLGGDVLGGAINIITKKENIKFLDASQSYSSFNTLQTALAGRFISKKGIAVNATSFVNHSDNDYPVDIKAVVDSTNLLKPITIRRPNNAYTSVGLTLEAGVVNKKWADRFLIGGVFSADRKGLQAITMTSSPIMHAFRREVSFSPTVKYEKFNLLTKGLNLRFSGLYTNTQSESIDTNRTSYYWDGRINPRVTSQDGRPKSYVENGDYTVNTTTTLMYNVGPIHHFVLSHNWNNYTRDSYDRFSTSTIEPPVGKISKQITGLSYQLSLLDRRWVTTLFVKGYFMKSAIGTEKQGFRSTNIVIPGRGIASTFTLGLFQLKTSYEYALTMPNAEQILGDGSQFSQPNLDLKPEQSHNLNAGLVLNKRWNGHSLMAEGNFFFRNPHNYIRLYSNGMLYQYRNDDVVLIRGVEGNLHYGYKDFLYLDASATYQNKRVDTRYLENGLENPLYGDRIPNEPYLYGNINAGAFTKLRGKTRWRLGLNWNTSYTNKFPLGFESQSYDPIYVPRQISHDLGLTYSFRGGKYNVSLTGRNITDNLLIDNFNVPKPGRSIGLKLRINLTGNN